MFARLRKWEKQWISLTVTGLLALAGSPAFGQSPDDPYTSTAQWFPSRQRVPPPCCPPVEQPQAQPTPTTPEAQPSATPAPTTPDVNFEAPRSAAGLGESFALAAPTIFGDFLGPNIPGAVVANVPGRGTVILTPGANPNQVFPVGTTFNFPTLTPAGTVRPAGQPLTAPQPLGTLPASLLNSTLAAAAGVSAIVSRGSFRIAENESARPQDRVFCTYNFFYDINGSLEPAGLGLPISTAQREEIGFEKTFLDGNASLEMRLPFFQIHGSEGSSDIGDLSMILKYAFLNDRETGNVVSGGIVVTVPSGANPVPSLTPDIHPTILQPYGAVLYNFSDRFFYQGFLALAVPTDSRDVTLLFNDLSIGYTLYRAADPEALVTTLTPTFEAHVTTPLNHRGALTEPVGVADIVDLTAGVTLGLGKRSTLGIAICAPITGPKPFDVEALAQLNFRF